MKKTLPLILLIVILLIVIFLLLTSCQQNVRYHDASMKVFGLVVGRG